MISDKPFRRRVAALLTGISLATMGAVLSVTLPATPALAQSAEDFHVALESYGFWQPHPRYGEVWVPYDKPRSWRPYTVGRWVYTDEWGWYWASDADEQAWGWIAFHYGRWIFDRRLGWAWVPGEEWAPAWVNWRRSDAVVGWAPAPPEDEIYDYDDNPVYWSFVEPRYLAAPRLLPSYFAPAPRVNIFIRQTVVVNRTFVSNGGARFAVNPGVNPGFIAARAGRPLQTFNVRPRVLNGTVGVAGAVSIAAAQNRVPGAGPGGPGARRGPQGGPRQAPALPAVQIQAAAAVQPAQNIAAPQPLGRERGRLGNNPPRAAQGGAPVAPAAAPQRGPGTSPPSASPAPGATPPTPPAAAPTPPASDNAPAAITPQAPGDRSRPFGPGNRPPGAPGEREGGERGAAPGSSPAPTPPSPAPAARPNAEPAPAARPATPPPAAEPRRDRPAPEARPERPSPEARPPRQEQRPEPRAEPRQEQRPQRPPEARPPQAPPPQARPPQPPPQAAPPRPAAPPAPPPQARPAPPAPPAAAPPPPRPAAPPPPAAKPAPPPAAAPAAKPEEKK